ncbi:hypothetical protein ABKN59_006497 [Abortiporus biennis]
MLVVNSTLQATGNVARFEPIQTTYQTYSLACRPMFSSKNMFTSSLATNRTINDQLVVPVKGFASYGIRCATEYEYVILDGYVSLDGILLDQLGGSLVTECLLRGETTGDKYSFIQYSSTHATTGWVSPTAQREFSHAREDEWDGLSHNLTLQRTPLQRF